MRGGDSMELTPWKPEMEVGRLRREMDDLWRRFFGEGVFEKWAPPVDISEDADNYLVKAELPGLDSKDIDISVSGDMLTIKGEKKKEAEHETGSYYTRERFFGSFRRSIRLPAGVNPEKVDAAYKNGVLTISLPKSREARAKKIEIKSD
jgi:HSP20 family protein